MAVAPPPAPRLGARGRRRGTWWFSGCRKKAVSRRASHEESEDAWRTAAIFLGSLKDAELLDLSLVARSACLTPAFYATVRRAGGLRAGRFGRNAAAPKKAQRTHSCLISSGRDQVVRARWPASYDVRVLAAPITCFWRVSYRGRFRETPQSTEGTHAMNLFSAHFRLLLAVSVLAAPFGPWRFARAQLPQVP